MSDGRKFTTVADAIAFIQAGNAVVTLVSLKTGARYTYKIRESKDGRVHFVSVMYGSDNETEYTYIGILRDGEFQWTKKSKISKDDVRWKAFDWAYANLVANRLPDVIEIWHEGRCGRCGRRLTVPESIERGIGPECSGKTKKAGEPLDLVA